jgi:cytochrome P450
MGSVSLHANKHPIIDSYKTILHSAMMKMLGLGWLTSKTTRDQAIAHIDDVAMEVLRNHRSAPRGPCGSLIALLDASHSNKNEKEKEEEVGGAAGDGEKALTDREIIDNIKIFLFAGHDSTTSTILWVLFLLAWHPLEQQRARDEVFALEGLLAAPHSLTELVFLKQVVKETLRLYPPAWSINRAPKRDSELAGYCIPKGTSIMINTLRLHRREDLGWTRPTEFLPSRWAPATTPAAKKEEEKGEGKEKGKGEDPGGREREREGDNDRDSERLHQSKAAFCYLPFGGGPRSCVGQPLAEVEVLVTVALLLQSFSLEIEGRGSKPCNLDIDFFSGATIRPKHIGRLRLVAREQ